MVCSRPMNAPRETEFTRVKRYLGVHNIRSHINILYFTSEISNSAIFFLPFLFYFICDAHLEHTARKGLAMRFVLTTSRP